jgi:hypothetical protein
LSVDVMKHCPICRALLNGASTCRRCRAELHGVQEVERLGRRLAGAAMHRLALGETVEAVGLLRRACAIHAIPELLILLRYLMGCPAGAGSPQSGEGGEGMTDASSAVSGA